MFKTPYRSPSALALKPGVNVDVAIETVLNKVGNLGSGFSKLGFFPKAKNNPHFKDNDNKLQTCIKMILAAQKMVDGPVVQQDDGVDAQTTASSFTR